ncbi:alpha-glucan water dikinase protein [Artemisia annua]|uniref:Alpha-glucan water dikinase protein n=1 Tax=Artemisia annua TaxID=35608 RepID=A0A2U1LE89_ARTAN|nr:alpha-glucan water dikinase protein [Artemisia annua]
MVGVNGFPELLQFVLEHVEDKNVETLLEGLLEAHEELSHYCPNQMIDSRIWLFGHFPRFNCKDNL